MPKMHHLALPRLASPGQALIYMEHQRIPHCKVILNYFMHEPRHLPQPRPHFVQNFHKRKNSHTLHWGKGSMLTFHKLFVKPCLLLRTMTEHPTRFSFFGKIFSNLFTIPWMVFPSFNFKLHQDLWNSRLQPYHFELGSWREGKKKSLGYSFLKQEFLQGL